MKFSVAKDAEAITLKIEGELDAVSVAEIRGTLDKLVEEKHKSIVVDLSSLRLIDSSGLGAVVSLYKRVRANGGAVTVRGVHNQPLAIFKLLRLDRVLLSS